MTKERLRIIIGENIRNERLSRNISIDELAEMIELTSGFVGLIERGQRGTTPGTLVKLADVFGISIDTLFYRHKDISLSLAEESKSQAKHRKIKSLTTDFSDIELDFVISTIKNIRAINRAQVKKDDWDLDENDDF